MADRGSKQSSNNSSSRPTYTGDSGVIKHSAVPSRPVTPNTGIKTDVGSNDGSANTSGGNANSSESE